MTPAASILTLLVDAAARSLLLAGAVGCGLWILRVRNVVGRKAAWILVLFASLAMPAVAHWAAHIRWLPDKDTFVVTGGMWFSKTVRNQAPPVSVTARAFVSRQPDAEKQPGIAVEPTAAVHSLGASRFPAPAITQAMDGAAAAAPAAASTPLLDRVRDAIAWLSPAGVLLLLYFAVGGALLLRLGFGAWAALSLWRRAEPVSLERLTAGIQVRSSRAIASPVTVGGGIVLPANYSGWDREKLAIVLAHEGSHVRQRDFALQLAASLYIALFWFSPVGWWLKRKLSDLSETISDGAAVHQAASHASYAQVLLEFAALPRPIPIGVAMAHRGHLRSRIEHLLNENNFRQAFSGGRARVAVAVLLVPVALFAATALVRVHAAGQQTPPAQTPDQTSAPAQTVPAPAQSPAPPATPPAAGTAGAPAAPPPPAPPGGDNLSAGPGASSGPGSSSAGIYGSVEPDGSDAPAIAKAWAANPQAQALLQDQIARAMAINAKAWARNGQATALLKAQMARAMALDGKNFFRNGYWNDGNPYAYVTGPGDSGIHYSGNWFDGSRDQIDKARTVAHGDFLWFQRDGKSYVIDDPAILAQIKPMQDKIDELGKQQEALGKQQDDLGKQQEALGRQMEQLKVPTPDMKKELDDLQAVQSKLAAVQGKDATREQLAEIEGQLADVQGKIGALQGDTGGRMGDLGGKMGELGAQQGKLGAEQGRLGAQQGRLAREMDGKILTIIDESLKNGKARKIELGRE